MKRFFFRHCLLAHNALTRILQTSRLVKLFGIEHFPWFNLSTKQCFLFLNYKCVYASYITRLSLSPCPESREANPGLPMVTLIDPDFILFSSLSRSVLRVFFTFDQ